MKKILYNITMLLALGLLASCVQDVDDKFDTSASERVQNNVNELNRILKGAEYGWVMEYYPHSDQKFGGYIYTLVFGENDVVTVSEERKNNASAKQESLYSIKKDKGPTLNFDTYNEIFHFLADPDPSWASNYGLMMDGSTLTEGYGYEGDYEFVLNSILSDKEIILKGKKTDNIIRMTALEEPSEEYLTKLIAKRKETEKLPNGTVGFKTLIDGKEFFLEHDLSRHFTVFYDGEKIGTAAECPTLTGMKLYEPLEVAGRTLQNFSFANNTFTCLDEGATDIALTPFVDPTYLSYEEYIGDYLAVYDNDITKTYDVSIEALEEGQTFKLKGVMSNYDLILNYNKQTGRLYLNTQRLWTDGNRDLWLCATDPLGNLGWYPNTGMVLKWNQKRDDFVLTFEDYGSGNGHVFTGFYQVTWDTGSVGSNYEWVGALHWYMNTLTKKK